MRKSMRPATADEKIAPQKVEEDLTRAVPSSPEAIRLLVIPQERTMPIRDALEAVFLTKA